MNARPHKSDAITYAVPIDEVLFLADPFVLAKRQPVSTKLHDFWRRSRDDSAFESQKLFVSLAVYKRC